MPDERVRGTRMVVGGPSGRPSRAQAAAKTTATKVTVARRTVGKKAPAAKAAATTTAGERIDARIAELADWRGAMLARLRAIVRAADPDVVEEWKWRGVPVWSAHGIVCTGETYRSVVKMTFAKGASLPDPARLFNSSLDGNVRRAIDFREGDEPDEAALQALVRAAVALNRSSRRR